MPLAVLGLVAIAAAVFFWRRRLPDLSPGEMRLELTTPATTDPVSLALSPDGEKSCSSPAPAVLASVAAAVDSDRGRPLAGTEHASLPFWSPDSESVGFFADGPVKRIDLETGLVQRLAGGAVPSGAAWNRDGRSS